MSCKHPLSFSNYASALGLTLKDILLWGCGTGRIAGSTWKSTRTPFIFPIPFNRSAYSPNSLLVADWTAFEIIISLAVWNPILVANVVTWDQALFSFRFENYIPAGKTVAVGENVWEPLKLGLISGYQCRVLGFYISLSRTYMYLVRIHIIMIIWSWLYYIRIYYTLLIRIYYILNPFPGDHDTTHTSYIQLADVTFAYLQEYPQQLFSFHHQQ